MEQEPISLEQQAHDMIERVDDILDEPDQLFVDALQYYTTSENHYLELRALYMRGHDTSQPDEAKWDRRLAIARMTPARMEVLFRFDLDANHDVIGRESSRVDIARALTLLDDIDPRAATAFSLAVTQSERPDEHHPSINRERLRELYTELLDNAQVVTRKYREFIVSGGKLQIASQEIEPGSFPTDELTLLFPRRAIYFTNYDGDTFILQQTQDDSLESYVRSSKDDNPEGPFLLVDEHGNQLDSDDHIAAFRQAQWAVIDEIAAARATGQRALEDSILTIIRRKLAELH